MLAPGALPSADAGSTQAELTLIGLPSQKNLAERTGADRCWLDPYRASDLGVMLEALRQV